MPTRRKRLVAVMGGRDFLRACQRLPPARQQASTIVVHTTATDRQDLAQLADRPAAGRRNKPLAPEKVTTSLRQCLG